MQMVKNVPYRALILLSLVLLAILFFIPRQAEAQWPPFRFRLDPSYEDGQITYTLDFRNRANWQMRDVLINIPLPEGTRFLEANAQPSTEVSFDGQEVSFFTSILKNNRIRIANFTVEVTDTEKSEFTTKAWIAWEGEGEVRGDYLEEDISIDITQQPVAWKEPANVRLRLRTEAVVEGNNITYRLYPYNASGGRWLRMWDLKINVPVPEGTTFLSAESPPSFTASYDGREVSFSTLELAVGKDVEPLKFTVSTEDAPNAPVVTHAWASWKNSSRSAARYRAAVEHLVTGDIVVNPHASQQVSSDMIGDVVLPSYDLTSIAFQDQGDSFAVRFYTAGPTCQDNPPIEMYLFIDSDCNDNTGRSQLGLGLEYLMRYGIDQDRARIMTWNTEEEKWDNFERIEGAHSAGGHMTTVSIPYSLVNNDREFCWVARAQYVSEEMVVNPANDFAYPGSPVILPPQDATPSPAAAEALAATTGFTSNTPENQNALSDHTQGCEITETPPPAPPNIEDITGKLAVPIDNGQALYNVHIFSMPNGQEIDRIENARQPNFRPDGQRLLINRQGQGIEDVYEYNLETSEQTQVSEAPDDWHPFYDPWGNRVVYGNSKLTVGYRGQFLREESRLVGTEERDRNKKKSVYSDPRRPFIFVQCGLIPPHKESEPRCQDIPSLGKLVPAAQAGEIVGDYPVWTDDDMIAYRGCNTWAGSRLCGIYIVPSGSTRGFSDGVSPLQLTDHTSDAPSDTKGDLIAFTSYRDGNWEAYLMKTDGSELKNLSNHAANDGLPTISPDGQWIAFVSDRSGQWAVWVTPVIGGEPQKLFDLPAAIPWGDGDRAWQTERISWAP